MNIIKTYCPWIGTGQRLFLYPPRKENMISERDSRDKFGKECNLDSLTVNGRFWPHPLPHVRAHSGGCRARRDVSERPTDTGEKQWPRARVIAHVVRPRGGMTASCAWHRPTGLRGSRCPASACIFNSDTLSGRTQRGWTTLTHTHTHSLSLSLSLTHTLSRSLSLGPWGTPTPGEGVALTRDKTLTGEVQARLELVGTRTFAWSKGAMVAASTGAWRKGQVRSIQSREE